MKKGFTLIELLAVIVILSIIALIIIPTTINSIKNTRLSSLKETESAVVRSCESFIAINNAYIPDKIGQKIKVSIEDLKTHKYIKNVSDYGRECSGYVEVTKKSDLDLHFEPFINCESGYSTKGLVAHYDFDIDAKDQTGNERNGTETNINYTIDGIYNVATFSATSSIVFNDIYNNASLKKIFVGSAPVSIGNNNENTTYMAWIKPTTVDTSARAVFDDGNLGEGTLRLYNNRFYAVWGGGNTISYLTTVEPNLWYHVALTHENDNTNYNFKLYINGELKGSSSVLISSQATTYGPDTPFRVGNNFIGNVDEIKLYNQVLSLDDIIYEYERTKGNR